MSRGKRDDAALRREDAEARRLAQTAFDAPLVLEAGAGTGKTTALVARIASWCLGPGWERSLQRLRQGGPGGAPEDEDTLQAVAAETLSRVTAITFTDAAAAEMAKRVGQVLAALERGSTPIGVLEDALPALAVRRVRARALLGALDRLLVCTIHAWCRRLLARFPLEAGLHPHFEVDADFEGVNAVARETLEAYLPQAYAEPGDADALALAERRIGPALLEAELAALLQRAVPPEALAADPFTPARLDALRARLLEALEDALAQGARALAGLKGAKRSVATAEALAAIRGVTHAARIETPQAFEAFAAALAEGCDEDTLGRLHDWAREDFNGKETACLGEAKPRFAASCTRLETLLQHLLALDAVVFGSARRVLHPLLGQASSALRASGLVTFDGLLRGARDLLVGHPEVAQRLRRELDQLLVDEFQDTDRCQCDVVRAVALAGPPAERPALFLVGDPKQSIYGWRSADLRAYEEFVAAVEAEGGRRRGLHVNLRSVPAVLDEVDRVLASVLRERRGVQPRYQRLVCSEKRAAEAGFARGRFAPVEHWVSFGFDAKEAGRAKLKAPEIAQLEAAALARDLRALHDEQGVPWKDFGVLFRARGDLETYLDALRRDGIPFLVESDRSYYRRREVIDAAALLRCVLDRHDQLALLTWLRSPAVGVPDAAWIPLWARGFPALAAELRGLTEARREEIRALAAEAAGALPAELPGLERIRGWERCLVAALEALALLRESFARDPADVFLERLRSLTLLEGTEAARFLGVFRAANLERFFRELLERLAERGGDVPALLRWLRRSVSEETEAEEARPKDVLEDAVQVMTIHQAKGLDFRHVYVMQLHKGRGRGTAARPGAAEGADGFEYRLFGLATPGCDVRDTEDAALEAAERIRLLYVALTRAKDRLVLAAEWKQVGAGDAALRAPEAAVNHAELLAHRAPPAPDLEALLVELAASGDVHRDASEARFVFPVLAGPADRAGAAPPEQALPATEQVEEAARALAARRAGAAAHERRAFHGPASEAAHALLREHFAEQRSGEPEAAPRRRADAAMAIGSAVHLALERLDPAADPDTELARLRAPLEDLLARTLAPGQLASALERAEAILAAFLRGPLAARLREIAPCVLARELPVLLLPPAEDAGPVGFVAGAIDLVYRDPADGAIVVADYKSDEVADEATLAERARAYAPQGEAYTLAVQQALGLAARPRFELWFLQSGCVKGA